MTSLLYNRKFTYVLNVVQLNYRVNIVANEKKTRSIF